MDANVPLVRHLHLASVSLLGSVSGGEEREPRRRASSGSVSVIASRNVATAPRVMYFWQRASGGMSAVGVPRLGRLWRRELGRAYEDCGWIEVSANANFVTGSIA